MPQFVYMGWFLDAYRGIRGLDENQKAVKEKRQPAEKDGFMFLVHHRSVARKPGFFWQRRNRPIRKKAGFLWDQWFHVAKETRLFWQRRNRPIRKKAGFLSSQASRRPPLPEHRLTGCVFGHMFVQLAAPQRLKCAATPIQRIDFCKTRILTSQITPFDLVGGNPCVLCHKFWVLGSGF